MNFTFFVVNFTFGFVVAVVQLLTCVSLSATPQTAARQASLSFTILQTISFTHFPSCLQSFPASGSFPMSRLFVSGGQSIGASVLTSVLPMNIQGWFPLVLTSLISFLSKGLSRVFSSTIIQKYQFFGTQPSLWSQLSHPYMTIGKTVTLSTWAFVGKVMSLLFNTAF